MPISSIGGDASQAWQALKESRAKQGAGNSAAHGTAALPPQGAPPAPPSPASLGADGSGGVSGASAKIIADLKALFIDLQAGGTSNTTGATGAGGGATASPEAAASASGAAGMNPSSTVPSDLKTLFGDLSKVGGHGGHHHGHGKPPAATAGTTVAGAAPAGASAPSGSLFDQLAGALKAYAASSLGNATGSATAPLNA